MKYLKGFITTIITISATIGFCLLIKIAVSEALSEILIIMAILGIAILTYIFANEVFGEDK